MWWRVPKRALAVGSVLLVGRLVMRRLRRRANRLRMVPESESDEEFQDTVPAFWSHTEEHNA
jgi:hypothetical protein